MARTSIEIPASTPEDYVRNAGIIKTAIKPIIDKSGQFPLVNRLIQNLMAGITPKELEELTQRSATYYLNKKDLAAIDAQMWGVWVAALNNKDVRTALLALETIGYFDKRLHHPSTEKAFNFAIDPVSKKLYSETMNEIFNRRIKREQAEKIAEAKRLKPRPPNTAAKESNAVEGKMYNGQQLTKMNHTGTADVYFIGGPDGKSILKLASFNDRERFQLIKEIEYLQAAKGSGGLPVLETIVKNEWSSEPRGMQTERVFGESLSSAFRNMTPERFPLSNRL